MSGPKLFWFFFAIKLWRLQWQKLNVDIKYKRSALMPPTQKMSNTTLVQSEQMENRTISTRGLSLGAVGRGGGVRHRWDPIRDRTEQNQGTTKTAGKKKQQQDVKAQRCPRRPDDQHESGNTQPTGLDTKEGQTWVLWWTAGAWRRRPCRELRMQKG